MFKYINEWEKMNSTFKFHDRRELAKIIVYSTILVIMIVILLV